MLSDQETQSKLWTGPFTDSAGLLISGTTVADLATIGSLACGPFLMAFAVGVIAGCALYCLNEEFGITDKLSKLYDKGLAKLAQVWNGLGTTARARFDQLAHSQMVHDLQEETSVVAAKLARQAGWVRGDLAWLW